MEFWDWKTVVMTEAEIANIELSPSERNYVKLRTTPSFARKISRRDVFIALLGITCLYLLNSRFAANTCTLLTSVPAAFFTYKVLCSGSTSEKGYKSILFYWALKGGLGLLDIAFNDSYGYYLAKFLVMSLAFGHAASQNKEIFTKMATSPTFNEDFTQCLTSIVSMYDTEGFAIQSPRVPLSSSSIYMDSYTCTACPIHSEDIFSMASTQKNTPEKHHGINRALTPHPDAFLEDKDFIDTKHAVGDCGLVTTQESHCTIGMTFGDIITNPMETIVFKENEETKNVTVMNVCEKKIMWALKCNALHRLAASPACGVISRGGQETIRLTCRRIGDSFDKLAIDYAFIEKETQYNAHFIEMKDKRRHLLRIGYES